MKPDDFTEPETEAADRRDNRKAVIVAVVAAIVVGVASGIVMASQSHAPQQAVPSPVHSSAHIPSSQFGEQ